MTDDTVETRQRLMGIVSGAMAAQVVGVAARWRLIDRIGDGARSAEALGHELGAPTRTTNRLLRAMAALGLLTEPTPGEFTLTPTGALLRTDRPDTMHGVARMLTDPTMSRAWERLAESVHTGQTQFGEVFGTDFFHHLAGQPELSELFNTAMSQATRGVAATVPSHFAFDRYDTVMDIGGGDGTLISAILTAHPTVRGILFDTTEGAAQAPERLRAAGLEDRCAIETGDFFRAVPEGADVHLVKSILHDWDDDQVTTILQHSRRVLPADGRLLIIEPVLPDTVDPAGSPLAYLNDLNMLVNVGGMERTRRDFQRLCERADFALTDVIPLPPHWGGFAIVEATPSSAIPS